MIHTGLAHQVLDPEIGTRGYSPYPLFEDQLPFMKSFASKERQTGLRMSMGQIHTDTDYLCDLNLGLDLYLDLKSQTHVHPNIKVESTDLFFIDQTFGIQIQSKERTKEKGGWAGEKRMIENKQDEMR